MRVLNVNSTLGLKTGGGTAERTFQMSRFLAKNGIECKILTLDIDLDEQRIANITPASVVVLRCLWKRYYVPSTGFRTIRQLVEWADVIHIMGHWGVLNAIVYIIARLANKPYVVCPAGALPLFGRSKLVKKLYNHMVGYAIIRNASGWIAVTKSEFSQFLEYGIGAEKITVIPNGIDTEDFSFVEPIDFFKKYSLSNNPIILFMGRLNLIKGPDILLEAFILANPYINNYQLVFAGPDGGMLSDLKQRSKEAGISSKVHFIGYLDGHDKSTAYHVADLLVVPSRQEAMSIVALEAMVCGTPVLLTNQCGFDEVKSVSDHLEVPVDANKMAKKMVSLLTDKEMLKGIAISLRNFAVQNYTWEQVVPQFLNLYRTIIKKR